MRCVTSKLCAAIAALLCAASVAFADDITPTDDEQLDEVIVNAVRIEPSGGGRPPTVSREELDNSDQVDLQGFFDDIEGVSTLGDGDERNRISIDGLSHELIKVTLDGDGFIEGRGSGGFGPGDLPTEMVLRVDVYRNPTAAMEEGGAGGRVSLRTRNPVDIPRPTNSLRAKLGYVPDKGDFSPSASMFMARPSASRKFGYMLSLSLSDRERNFGSQDITSWALDDFDGTSAYYPTQLRNNAVSNEQSDIFAGLVMAFRPHESLDISSKIFLSRRDRDIENLGLPHRLARQRNIVALAFDERIVTELQSSDDQRANLRLSGSTRADQIDGELLGADLIWRLEDWRVEGTVGYSRATSESDAPSLNVSYDANSAFGYATGSDASLIPSHTPAFPELEAFVASRINLSEKDVEDTSGFVGADAIRPLGDGVIRRLRTGAKIRELGREQQSTRGVVDFDDLLLSDSEVRATRQTPWDDVAWPAVNMDFVDRLVQASEIEWDDNLLNDYDVELRSTAGYVQAGFRAPLSEERSLIGNIGIRAVGTETWIDGYQDYGEGPAPVSLKNSYTDFLPALNARVRIWGRSTLTFGAARVMTYPQFNDLAPGVRVNLSDKTGKSGNPELLPFRANQVLAEFAWVPGRGRQLNANITYRDVRNFTALGEELVEVGDDTFLLTRPINGGKGSILSASVRLNHDLQRLADRLRGFALSVSYTHNHSETDFLDPVSGDELPIPNTAEHFVKAGLNYNSQSFGGRLRYQWRGKSLRSSFSESDLSIWNEPVGSLDLGLSWQLKRNVRIGLDARNLLDEERIQTTDYSGQLMRINEQDRSLALTLRAKWT